LISFLLMKVANDKEARIEKNTKELGTFVILNQKSVLDYLDQILEKFETIGHTGRRPLNKWFRKESTGTQRRIRTTK